MVSVFDAAQRMMMWGVWLNLVLCFFNLIPIPPLDGSHQLYPALPPAWGTRYRQLGQFGFLPLMAVMFLFRPLIDFFLLPAHWLGAFVNSCTDSKPYSCAFKSALDNPPATDKCDPNNGMFPPRLADDSSLAYRARDYIRIRHGV